MKKFITIVLALILCLLTLTGCGTYDDSALLDRLQQLEQELAKAKAASGIKGNDGITPHIGDDGYWYFGNTKTEHKAVGSKGTDGATPTVEINTTTGNWTINGVDTGIKAKGDKGTDGTTPTVEISTTTENWVVNGVDTGVKAQGTDGDTPTVEIDAQSGNWIINGADTGVKAQGADGDTPTIEIDNDGFWVINGVDTGVKAQGDKGDDGDTPTVEIDNDGFWAINGIATEIKATPTIEIDDDGFWVINGVDTGVKAQGDKGDDGDTPTVEIDDDGFWAINGVATEIKAQGDKGADGVTPHIGEDGFWYFGTTKTVYLATQSATRIYHYGETFVYKSAGVELFSITLNAQEGNENAFTATVENLGMYGYSPRNFVAVRFGSDNTGTSFNFSDEQILVGEVRTAINFFHNDRTIYIGFPAADGSAMIPYVIYTPY